MQVRIEDVSPVEKKMVVEIPWEVVSQKLGQAYRDLGREVALKGFRKGKAPRSVLEQVYGPRVNAEVAVQLVRESFFAATAEHKLAAVAEPRVEEGGRIQKGQPFSFAAIVEVRGEVEPKDYTGMPLERRRIKVADEAVDAGLEALRKEHTELVPIEGREVTAPGDVVALKITGSIGEHNVDQPRFAIDLDEGEREPVPGLRAALIGLPLGTTDKALSIPIPEDAEDENLRGRKAELVVSILEARAKDVPALDDEFAKDTGKADTLDGLRASVRKDLEDREREQTKRETREAALRELIKRNQIPVAASLIDRAVEIQYNRLRAMLGMQPDEDTAGLSDDLREKMRPTGADEVRGQLLLEAIADKEKVAITDAELTAHVEQTAKLRNIAPQRLRAEWERDGRLDNVKFSLRQDKVLDLLVEQAAITEVDQLTAPAKPEGGPDLPDLPDAPDAPIAAHSAPGHVHGPDCDHG
jgi:trigger factor